MYKADCHEFSVLGNSVPGSDLAQVTEPSRISQMLGAVALHMDINVHA